MRVGKGVIHMTGPISEAHRLKLVESQRRRRQSEARKREMLVDQKCFDLAEYFVDSVLIRSERAADIQALAEMIQDVCETFVADVESKL